MNRRVVCGWLLAGLLAAGCGGGMKPITFASDNKPLAESLLGSVKRKDLKAVQHVAATADNRAKMMAEEKTAFKWVAGVCEKEEWDKAQDFLEKSIANSK